MRPHNKNSCGIRLILLGLFLLPNAAIVAAGPSSPSPGQLSSALQEEWTQVVPTGTPPSARKGHLAWYDPARNRLLVIAGYDGSVEPRRNDVWQLSFSGPPQWTKLAPGGATPWGRELASVVHDPDRDRLLIFGGLAGGAGASNDSVWALNLSPVLSWVNITPSGGSRPVARSGHTAIYDPHSDRMIIHGGISGGSELSDTWALSLAATPSWERLADAPTTRTGHTAVLDLDNLRMIVFGGVRGSTNLQDAYSLQLAGNIAWTQLSPPAPLPGARREHAAVWDPVGHRMLVFAGASGSGRYKDLWALSLVGAPTWTLLSPAGGGALTARNATSLSLDPGNHRLVVFGGRQSNAYANDVWQLALTWGSVTGVRDEHHSGDSWVSAPYPNPSASGFSISLRADPGASVAANIVDIQGRKLRELNLGPLSNGDGTAAWDGKDELGKTVPPGAYFILVRSGTRSEIRKVVLLPR